MRAARYRVIAAAADGRIHTREHMLDILTSADWSPGGLHRFTAGAAALDRIWIARAATRRSAVDRATPAATGAQGRPALR